MYERFYKFSARPFLLTPDARYFFPSSGHKRALAFLRYGVSQGEGFVVITGGVGTGKTTLVQALLKELAGKHVSATSIVTTQLEDAELVRLVAANFGLEYRQQDKVVVLKTLENYLKNCAAQGKRALLIVDEAQNLPARSIEELRMLSNFQANGKPLLQTFLLGQEELRARIASTDFEQLRQRITAVHHLGPLDVNETKSYIEHRLKLAGWEGDPRIDQDAFLKIHEFTKGVPRRINTLCDRILLFGYLDELHRIGNEAVTAVIDEVTTEYEGIEPRTASGGSGGSGRDHLKEVRPAAPRDGGAAAGDGQPPGELHGDAQLGPQAQGSPRLHADLPHLEGIEKAISALNDTLKIELGALREVLIRIMDERKD